MISAAITDWLGEQVSVWKSAGYATAQNSARLPVCKMATIC